MYRMALVGIEARKLALVGMESVMGTKTASCNRFSLDILAGWGI